MFAYLPGGKNNDKLGSINLLTDNNKGVYPPMLPETLNNIIKQIKELIRTCITYLFLKAIAHNKPYYAQLLLILGANVNAIDIYGNTALHMACKQKMQQIFNILINRSDLDISIPDANGVLAIYLANTNGYTEATNQLLMMDIGPTANIKTAVYESGLYMPPAPESESESEQPESEDDFIYIPEPLKSPPVLIRYSQKAKRENRQKGSPPKISFNHTREEHKLNEPTIKESFPTFKIEV